MRFMLSMLIMGLLASCMSTKNATDLQEYGYHGKVKSITAITYTDVPHIEGEWILSDDLIYQTYVRHINEEGNIYRVEESFSREDSIWATFSTIIEFKEGLKSSFTKRAEDGTIDTDGTYSWSDNRHYTTQVNMGDVYLESFAVLGKKFREINGGNTYFRDEDTLYCETYVNNFSSNGDLISASYNDLSNKERYTMIFDSREYDERGNLIKVAMVNNETLELQRLVVRVFEYYD